MEGEQYGRPWATVDFEVSNSVADDVINTDKWQMQLAKIQSGERGWLSKLVEWVTGEPRQCWVVVNAYPLRETP